MSSQVSVHKQKRGLTLFCSVSGVLKKNLCGISPVVTADVVGSQPLQGVFCIMDKETPACGAAKYHLAWFHWEVRFIQSCLPFPGNFAN